MIKRFIHWLLGIPRPEDLEARRRFDAERDPVKTAASVEASRSNLAGGKGSGTAPRDWTGWVP